MHQNDFRADLAPTRAQYKRLCEGLLATAGEEPPGSRQAACELILRVEADPGPEPESAAAAHELAGLKNLTETVTSDAVRDHAARASARADRLGERRTLTNPRGLA